MRPPFDTPELLARGFCACIARGLLNGFLVIRIPDERRLVLGPDDTIWV